MSERDTFQPAASKGPITRTRVVDAAARVVARRGDHSMHWPTIATEAGDPEAAPVADWFEDPAELVDACYARTAQAYSESLLKAETAAGNAMDKIAVFLVSVLEFRRERGSLLSFRRGRDLPMVLQRRLHERDQMVRTRLKRLLAKGRRDGSLALRNLDSACELILASLQVPDVAVEGAEQRMWDSELVEMLLAALAEPHPPEAHVGESVRVAQGKCLCGTVRYEIEGAFEVMRHCQCSMCRRHHGAAFATFVSVPLSAFRWVSGEEAITTFQSSAYGLRAFCSKCGSVTPAAEPDANVVICPAGNLDGESGIRGDAFAGSHDAWQAIAGKLGRHEEVG